MLGTSLNSSGSELSGDSPIALMRNTAIWPRVTGLSGQYLPLPQSCDTKHWAQEPLVRSHSIPSGVQIRSESHLVRQVLEGELGLTLSPEKTKITTYGKGYDFLGFRLSSRSRRMRDKSVQKFKAKVRELTERHHNLDLAAVEKLNRVIRGTANYFAADFATCRWMFQKLDSWIRMRLRAMKLKRKNYNDNQKLRVGFFRRQLGLLTLEEFCRCQDQHGQARYVIPRHGATSVGVAR